MNYRFLETDEAVNEYFKEIKANGITELGVDLEADFNLHSYGEKLCLIQLYDGREAVLIDPLKINPYITKKFFENKKIAKIMFDSSSDQRLLYKIYQIRIHNIIDLKPAVDLLRYPKLNLGYLLTDKIGLPPFDKKSFQRYNWQSRPLDGAAVQYAISDVLYLFTLRELLFTEMREKRLLLDYLGKNSSMQDHAPNLGNGPAIFRKLLYISLKKAQREIFQEIYAIREAYAKKLDLPAFQIFSNEKLRKLCTRPTLVQTLDTRTKIDQLMMEELRSEIEQVHFKAEAKKENQAKAKGL